ncbi:MAG: TolC family protein [Terrimicrobiaceae bacterium]
MVACTTMFRRVLLFLIIGTVSACLQAEEVREVKVLEVDLPGAIQLALQKNFRLEEESFGPKIATQRLRSASGKFDPVLEWSYTYDQNLQELRTLNNQLDVPTPLPGEELPDLFSLTSGNEIDSALAGLTPWGMTYDFGASLNWDNDDRRNPDFTRYNSFLGVSLAQPLLRNFGTDANMASIRIARADRAISSWQLRQEAIDLVTECVRVYSELCFAIENLAVEIRSRQLSAQLVSDNLKRAAIGVMAPLDVLQARTDLAAREERVLVAKRAVEDNENFLKQLITDEIEGLLGLRVRPTPPRIPQMNRADIEKDFARAFELRPDYKQALLDIQKKQINVVFTRNQALPRLDLVASFGVNGIDTNLADSISRTFGKDGQNVAWDVGAVFSVPVFNRTAVGEREAAQLETAQALVGLKRLEQQILVEADNAAGQIETTAKRIEATSVAREFAGKTLEAAQARLASGTTTTFEVLQFQRDLATAEVNELRARADHIISLAEYARATGTTLERNRITFEEGQ